MNNFQLNNTSVYLGGQCKWDIVLSKYDNDLVVTGFQLTPLSNNIPFNKRGEVGILNDDHSYTLKKFCTELKENFWSADPCLSELVKDESGKTIGYYDNSFIAGLKRAQTFQVYHKQYEYLQPVWLEKLSEDDKLQFKFNIYSVGANGQRRLLNYRILNLSYNINNISFHNSFVEYFRNWIKYLGINEGNDRVMCVDIRNEYAELDGVSTLSGQRSGKVSCDYIISNLLSYERPNIETDYILGSLFKNHNTITSQLFNFNFCFDVQDIFDSFFITQLKGYPIHIDCDVLINGSSVEKRTIFSNYEKISRDLYNPFIFMDCMTPVEEYDSPTGEFIKNYYINYYLNEHRIFSSEINVLDYLRDPYIEDLKNTNKLTQPITHIGYVKHFLDTFNLYEGYHPYNVTGDSDEITSSIDLGLYSIPYSIPLYEGSGNNGISVLPDTSKPTKQNGYLNWIYPKSILYFDTNWDSDNPSRTTVELNIYNKFGELYEFSENPYLPPLCKWTIEDSLLNEYYSGGSGSPKSLTFLYVKDYLYSNVENLKTVLQSANNDPQWVYDDINAIDGKFIMIFHNKTEVTDFLIVSNDLNKFSLHYICENLTSTLNTDFNEFVGVIKECATTYQDQYSYYGFGQELEVGRDNLDKECYYKSNSRKTFVYRKCGKLSPYMISDPNDNLNYFYFKDIDNNIDKIPLSLNTFENCVPGGGQQLVLFNELNFIVNREKGQPSWEKTVQELIKDYLKTVYGTTDSDLIDYIYSLYEVSFNFEYKTLTSLDNIEYNIKLILK